MLIPLKSRKNPEINSFKILKDNYPKFDIIPGKKIYVSRKNSPHRNVSEEEQIEEYFKKINYEIIYFENLTILEQSKVCQESEKIVCLYGTNLLNCGFCSNKTTVISIKYNIPSDSWTLNSAYNRIFKQNSIKHVELSFNGDSLLPFIKQNEDLW
jgi:capsular polysaccharide biosynthesis protein